MKSHMVIVKITWENVFKTICNAQHIKSTNNIKLKVPKQLNKYLFARPLRALH